VRSRSAGGRQGAAVGPNSLAKRPVIRGHQIPVTPMPSNPAHIDSDEIFQRLAHLQTLDMQVTSVQEVVYPLSTTVVSLLLVSTAVNERGETRL